jgi:hypothetical protein
MGDLLVDPGDAARGEGAPAKRGANMTLSRIVMRLARNPGTEFAGGDDHRGYALTAPLTGDGHLDENAFSKARAKCTVRRFAPDEDAQEGRLMRRGERWYFDYDETTETDNEPLYRLGQHRFAVGEYVSVTDEDGRLLTYKVTEIQPCCGDPRESGNPASRHATTGGTAFRRSFR